MQRSSSKCESNNSPGDRPNSSSEADWMKKKTEKKRNEVKLTRKTQQNTRRNTTSCGRKTTRTKGFCRQQKKCTRSNGMKNATHTKLLRKKKTAPNFKPRLVTVENNSHRSADGWMCGWMI
jgi:hypothetical protein